LIRAHMLEILSPIFSDIKNKGFIKNKFVTPVELIGENVSQITGKLINSDVYYIAFQMEQFNKQLFEDFDFALLHELAHIFLNEYENEEKCDCEALKILMSINENVNLGIFDKWIVYESKYWGGYNFRYEKRLNKLEEMIETKNIICK
jgi:hypothetical protein